MPQRYTRTAVGLHWLIALLIAGAFGLGWFMSDLPLSPDKLKYYAWHKWLGVTVFLLAVLRVAWRLSHRPPEPPTMPAWQLRASTWSHRLLYGLIFVLPLSGWLYSSASGYPVVYLGLVQLPDLIGKNKQVAALFHEVHELLGYAMLALLAAHVAGAIKHQFLDRDGLMARMWFGR